MKFIHLSDLHIGKRVHEVSMLEDQIYIFRQILEIIDREQVQCVLISGDVYDKTIPSIDAVGLLDDFLCDLAMRKLQVMIISGNHDSPERLSFGGRLLEGTGIHISQVYQGENQSVTLTDEFGPVHFWLLPFVKPAHVRRWFPDAAIESYTDALSCAIDALSIDREKRNVLLTHQFVTGSQTCDSEEIQVGGTDNVDSAVLEGFDYVALGHIHSPQHVGKPWIRYCGTPLKYSFSEARQKKSVTVVTLLEKGSVTIETRPLTPLRDLREISGTYEEITALDFYRNTNREDYLHIILTDEEDVPEAMGRLRVIYPNLLKLSYRNTRTMTDNTIDAARQIQKKDPITLFDELYTLQNNQPMSQVQRSYLRDLIDSIWEDSK